MKSFTDTAGRTWCLTLTVGAAWRLREETGLDIMAAAVGAGDDALADPLILVDALWLLCEGQADRHGVSLDQFGEALDAEAMDAAAEAFLAALTAFFPEAKDRKPAKDEKPPAPEELWAIVDEAAGVLGIDVRPYTLRQLLAWQAAKLKHQWDVTSNIVAAVFNSQRAKTSDPILDPLKLNPFRAAEAKAAEEARRHEVSPRDFIKLLGTHLKARDVDAKPAAVKPVLSQQLTVST